MPSTVAWLDTSIEEQRLVRDSLRLFEQPESRDELGLGPIRDSLSDLLFPGTSVLQTRARYFLIVPWSFAHAARIGPGRDLAARAKTVEQRVVAVLGNGNDEGVIGRRAGVGVKNLPSTIFWSGLVRYGILTRDTSPQQLTGSVMASMSDADELAERRLGEWHATVPPAPDKFPAELPGGLDLTQDEAEWLRERMVGSARDTLLEHLLLADGPPGASSAPWEDPQAQTAAGTAAEALRWAHRFSLMMNGAALLYNLLVAEAYSREGNTRVSEPVRRYQEEYALWVEKIGSHSDVITGWSAEAFWEVIATMHHRIPVRARHFVDAWTDAVTNGSAATAVAQGSSVRRLVAEREQSIKGGQSRLTNTKLLAGWNGASGTGELVFRWPQVRGIIADVHAGLAHA